MGKTVALTYFNVLTPWNRILLEKLTDSQPAKKFPAFYVTRRFITAFTSVRHLSRFFLCERFVTRYVFTVRRCQHLAQPPSWRTNPCRLSATAYSIYPQLPSILEAVAPSATWGRAMPWWQGPTYHGLYGTTRRKCADGTSSVVLAINQLNAQNLLL